MPFSCHCPENGHLMSCGYWQANPDCPGWSSHQFWRDYDDAYEWNGLAWVKKQVRPDTDRNPVANPDYDEVSIEQQYAVEVRVLAEKLLRERAASRLIIKDLEEAEDALAREQAFREKAERERQFAIDRADVEMDRRRRAETQVADQVVALREAEFSLSLWENAVGEINTYPPRVRAALKLVREALASLPQEETSDD